MVIQFNTASSSLVDLLQRRAIDMPSRRLYTFLGETVSDETTLSYGELHERARSIAAMLQEVAAPGERALLLYPPGVDYITGFCGCLYAAVVAVPAYPPDPMRIDRTLPRLRAMVKDAGATVVLTTKPILAMTNFVLDQAPELKSLRWIATDALPAADEHAWRRPALSSDTLAFLQYTSGSTGEPKGVMLSHGNLLHNLKLIFNAFQIHPDDDVGVSWLPPYHDMGLIGGILEPLYSGFEMALMSPVSFLRRPLRWLEAISHRRATVSGGPNFAFELCARKVRDTELERLDLSSWQVAFCGAEPIRTETFDRFCEVFARCGFRREALYPCYGLAESTLIVSGGDRAKPPVVHELAPEALAGHRAVHDGPGSLGSPAARAHVGSGRALPELDVRIVDPETLARRAPGEVGEVWVSGPSIARGYWGKPDETERTFHARPLDGGPLRYLRTGDLGLLLDDGELFVTGRLKDVIIIRGRNHYPQDIERTVEHSHPAVRPGCSAAFSLDATGGEQLAVVAEVSQEIGSSTDPASRGAIAHAIRQAISQHHELFVHTVVLLPPGGILKTSSGKIQRRATRQALASGNLSVLARIDDTEAVAGDDAADLEAGPEPAGSEDAGLAMRDALAAAPASARGGLLLGLLRHELARELRLDQDRIDPGAAAAALGLDSLGMLAVEGRLEAALGVPLPDAFLWRHATLATAAEELVSVWQAGEASPRPASAGAAGSASASATSDPAVSSGQARLWFLDKLMPDSAVYNVFSGLRMSGPLDEAALARSVTALVERHAVLRTTFVAGDDGVPHAVITPPTPVALAAVDLRGRSPEAPEAPEAEFRALCRAESSRPFDLAAGPLFRAALVRLAGDDHALILTMHHTVTDGWSMGILTRELAALYRQARRGEAPALPPAPRYDEYARRAHAAGSALDAQREFWKRKLDGLPRLELSIARARSGPASPRGATHRFSLPGELIERVREVARQRGTTLFAALLASFTALLHRYSGQSDLCIGTVAANRGRPEHRNLVGFLANTLVLRFDAAHDPSFVELIDRSRHTVSEALAHAELPFDDVVRLTRAVTDLDRNPLFQAAFFMESLPPLDLEVPGMTWTPILDVPDGSVEDTAKFDLALMMTEPTSRGDASLACQYSTDLFDEPSIRRLALHFEVLLRALCEAPSRPVSSLALLTEPERRRMLVDWNATAADYPRDATIDRLFAGQVARTPEATAVTFGDVALSYAELDRRSSRLAARLVASGVGHQARVALYLERSAELVVGLLGILKAGAAYVPLDPAYPVERVAFVLADASVSAIVTQEHLAADLPDSRSPVLWIDDAAGADEAPPAPAAGPTARLDPASLAYVIYTSGSTGRPKGVMVTHGSVVNFFASMDRRVGAEPPGVFLAVTSVAFDISVLELLWTLTRGFHVVVHAEQRTTAIRAGGLSRPPDFSLFYFAADEECRGSDRYRLLLDGARFADDHGFLAVWTPERHFHAFGGLYPNPSVTGAAVAAATRRVAIRAGSVVLPLHHPVRVAEEWSLVDNLSGGRVGVSFASGWHANDFALAPERYERRRDLMLEGMDLVRRLWRGERAELINGEGKPVEIGLRPRPVQRELPVWLTAAGNPETFRSAGELGASVLTHLLGQRLEDLRDKIAIYREARRRAGHDGPGHVTLMVHTFVHRDMEVVRARAAEPFRRYLKSSADLMRSFGRSMGIDIDDASFTEADLDAMVARAHERFFETSGLFGTPRSCEAMIARIEEIGVGEIACLIDFGIDSDAVLDSLPYLDALRRRAQRRRPAALTVPDQIAAHGVTHLQCTPSLAQTLLLEPDAERALAGLRALLVGGEALPAPLAARLHACAPGRVINMYGPTETTIWSATHAVRPDETGAVISIGTPIGNTALYVLDGRLEPVPIGVTGELYIGGAGLARGYHGRADLTAERFVPEPFAGNGARMYRTGDLARFQDDGSIDFLGRVDQQIKLRGFRIELGEIEATLAEHPGVREVAVAVREDQAGDQRLVAYVVPRGPQPPDAEELRRLARQRLPDYMVPSAVVVLQAMPMTPNGKLDRKRLPAPVADRANLQDEYVAPRTPVEDGVAHVFGKLLGHDRVGVHDDFFALGGHSLLATQVASQLQAMFHVELPVRMVFEARTPARLAERIGVQKSASAKVAATPIHSQQWDGEEPPLSFAQRRLWFLEQLTPGQVAYNIPIAIRLRGRLDVPLMQGTFAELVRRHQALRTTFRGRDGEPVLDIHVPQATWQIPVIDLSALPEAARASELERCLAEEAKRPFDLAIWPLLRTVLMRLDDDVHVLLLNMHHIVSDTWSMGVLMREVATIYKALREGQPSPLPELPIQYADFAKWQIERLTGEFLEAQLAYWKHQLAGMPPLLEVPTDHPRPAVQGQRGDCYYFTLPAALVSTLKRTGQMQGATLFMTLLAAFQALLARYSGQGDINVGIPIANRIQAELDPLIGFFVNTLVIRADLSDNPGFDALLARVKEATLGAYANQELPFDRIVEAVGVKRDLSRSPLVQVTFAFQNVPMPAPHLDGLEVSLLPVATGAAKFDLSLSLMESAEGLEGQLEYSEDLFERSTITRMAGHYQSILEAIAAEPGRQIGALPLLGPEERARVREAGAVAGGEPAGAQRIHLQIAAQAQQSPDMVALQLEDRRLGYGELEGLAGRGARWLWSRDVRPGSHVALRAERWDEALVGALAIWKAGAVVDFDDGADIRPVLGPGWLATLETWKDPRAADPLPMDTATTAAVVIHGCRIAHATLSRYADTLAKALKLAPGERVVLQSCRPPWWELLAMLRSGATVVTFGAGVAEAQGGAALAMLSPSELKAIPAKLRDTLRVVLIDGPLEDGEAPLPGHCELLEGRWTRPGLLLVEGYPPAFEAHVLEPSAEPAPLGIWGELCLGSLEPATEQVTDQATDQFVPNPHSDKAFALLYRTGQRARRRYDGTLQCFDVSRPLAAAGHDAPAGEPLAAPATDTERALVEIWQQILTVKEIGVHDSFFAIGGNSLLSLLMLSRVQDVLNAEVPLRAFFETPTIAAIATCVEAARHEEAAAGAANRMPPLQPVPRDGELALSFAQQRLWFLDQLDPGSALYNIPFTVRLRGKLQVESLRMAFEQVVQRHEVLRTTFSVRKGHPLQVVHAPEFWALPVVDLSGRTDAELELEVQRRVQEQARQAFALDQGPLLRATLLRLSNDEHVLVMCMHHIVSDGWSVGVLIEEVSAFYQAFSSGRASPLPPLLLQYADYAVWQRSWLTGDVLAPQLAYWKDQLTAAPPLDLPTDRPRPAVRSQHGKSYFFTLPVSLMGAVQQVGLRGGATPFMVLLGAFYVLLKRYSSQHDLSVGTPIASRTRPELESLIGFFVNTLVMRADLSGDPSFLELLQQVKDTALGAYAHQDIPFEHLVDALSPSRALDRPPLFQVMFALQNAPMRAPNLDGLEVSVLPVETGTAKFDLTLALMETPQGLEGQLEYSEDLFEHATITRMAGHYQSILEAIAADPGRRIGALPLLGLEERARLREAAKVAGGEQAGAQRVHLQIAAQAQRNPDVVALQLEDRRLGYGELEELASRGARWLWSRDVGPGRRVALRAERWDEALVGALAIWKAGAVVDFDGGGDTRPVLEPGWLATLEAWKDPRAADHLPMGTETSAAVVLDGCEIDHVTLARVAGALGRALKLSATERVIVERTRPPLLEVLAVLMSGATTIELGDARKASPQGAELGLLSARSLSVLPAEVAASLRAVLVDDPLVAGDAPLGSGCEYLIGRWTPPGLLLIETALPAIEAHVLEPHFDPAPLGVWGELCLGAGLSPSAAQAGERFLPHPWDRRAGAMLYRTGQRVRRRSNGLLQWYEPARPRPVIDQAVASQQQHTAPASDTEEKLLAIWREVLEVKSLRPNDNFFTLGGNSILSVLLLAQIQDAFGIELPVRALFESPTVAAVAMRIDDARRLASAPGGTSAASPSSLLLPLRTTGACPPLFFVHAISGSALAYQHLAEHIGNDQPFYGLHATGVDDDAAPGTDVREMARRYVEAMRSVQPEGPYQLGGWSFGGLVALEMAHQLRTMGQSVSTLALVDTWALNADEYNLDELTLIETLVRELGIEVPPGEIAALPPEARVPRVAALAAQMWLVQADGAERRIRRFLRVIASHLDAARHYVAPRYPEPITLLRAKELPSTAIEQQLEIDPSCGWRSRAGLQVRVHVVPGNHFSLIRPPHVRVLAGTLRSVLSKTSEK